jgi:hypothetical protein
MILLRIIRGNPLPCRLSHRLSRTFSRPASALGNRA